MDVGSFPLQLSLDAGEDLTSTATAQREMILPHMAKSWYCTNRPLTDLLLARLPCVFFWEVPLTWQGIWDETGRGLSWSGCWALVSNSWVLPSEPKSDISFSSDHLNPNYLYREFINLKKKSLVGQILRNSIHSRLAILMSALCWHVGCLFKLGPWKGSPSPCPRVFLFAFNCKWTLYKDLISSLPCRNWFIT